MPVFRAGKRLATTAVFPRTSQGSNRAMTPDEPRRDGVEEAGRVAKEAARES